MSTSTHINDPLFLGLNLSTQGLKAVLTDEEGVFVHESSINFDRDLPSVNGTIRGPGPGEASGCGSVESQVTARCVCPCQPYVCQVC